MEDYKNIIPIGTVMYTLAVFPDVENKGAIDGQATQVYDYAVRLQKMAVCEIRIGRALADDDSYGPGDSNVTYILKDASSDTARPAAFSHFPGQKYLLGWNDYAGVQQRAYPSLAKLCSKGPDGELSYLDLMMKAIIKGYERVRNLKNEVDMSNLLEVTNEGGRPEYANAICFKQYTDLIKENSGSVRDLAVFLPDQEIDGLCYHICRELRTGELLVTRKYPGVNMGTDGVEPGTVEELAEKIKQEGGCFAYLGEPGSDGPFDYNSRFKKMVEELKTAFPEYHFEIGSAPDTCLILMKG